MTPSAPPRPWRVLFLCTGNSARSIIAESLLRHWGGDAFEAHSAGSRPAEDIQPMAREVLAKAGLPVAGLHSKSMARYSGPGAEPMDFVITVCDRAAEECPVLPGQPITAHWGVPDPAAVEGDAETRRQAYRRVLTDFERRLKLFINLPLASLDRLARQTRLRELGDSEGTA